MTGFDTLYDRDSVDAELAETAVQTGRILLTRDRRLLMRKQLDRGYLVRTFKAQEQVLEVIRRYHLHDLIQPFQRCLTCNSPLVPVDKAEILERLQPLTRRYFDEFVFCPVCDQVFWKGSHYERMLAFIDTALMS